MTVLGAMFNGGVAEAHYGYDLAKQLKSHQAAYSIFRKLEAHDLVESWWEEIEGRRRRYYKLTGHGIGYCMYLFHEADTSGAPTWRPA